MFNFIQTHFLLISVLFFSTIVLVQMLYYCGLFFRFSFHKKQESNNHTHYPISIVISAKDLAHQLIKTIPLLMEQEYPEFEVVIVNDNSEDETVQLIQDFQVKHHNLRLIDLNSSITNIKGKKFPLSLGIKAAKYEHVLLTDAECFPATKFWLSNMAKNFNSKVCLVIGFSTFYKKRGILNAIIHYDILHSAMQYFSYYLAKMPYMGVGKNLAYTKSIFFENKGFASQNHLRFGDDDIFVNQVATYENCAIEYSPDSHIISRPNSDFKTWMLMKSFRFGTRKHYKSKHRFLLSLYDWTISLSYLSFGLALYCSLKNPTFLSIVCGIMVIKLIIQYLALGFSAKKLNEKKLTPYILLFDLLFSILNPLIYITSTFSKTK